MEGRGLRLLVIVMLTAGALTVPAATGTQGEARTYRVMGLTAAQMHDIDVDVLDDYGGFLTARMSDQQLARVTSAGGIAEALAFRTGGSMWWRDFLQEGEDQIPSSLRAPLTTSYYIVQFRGPIRAEWIDRLDNVGRIYEALPEHSLLAKLGTTARLQVEGWNEVRDVVPYHPAFKLGIDQALATGTVPLLVAAYVDAPLSETRSRLADAGFTETAYARGIADLLFLGSAHASKLDDIARVANVVRIEPPPTPPQLDNEPASSITQGGYTAGRPYEYPLHARGLDGSSQIVEVCDSGANTEGYDNTTRQMRMVHEAFADASANVVMNANQPGFTQPPHRKIDLYFSPVDPTGMIGDRDDSSGHGTHVAGTVAGDAPPYGVRNANDGVAYASKLIICDIYVAGELRPLLDYSLMYQPGHDRGARVSSNSWGSGDSRAYTAITRQNDAFAYEHPEFLIVRSQGNTGVPSMRVDAVAKNILAVGATQNVYSRAGAGTPEEIYWVNESLGSSWGPTLDGRIKPNIVAPGDCVVSSDLPDAQSYRCRSGTSMSTPQASAAAALVRDYFAKGFYPSGAAEPTASRSVSAALVRAILQVSGHEITGDRGVTSFPNHIQGWGRLTLDDALHFAGDRRKLLVVDEGTTLATGGIATFWVRAKPTEPLRIMLAWRDPPAAGCVVPALCDAQPNLVNDLDLVVVGPRGERYVGNAFVGSETPANALALRDTRNVEEAVYVAAPSSGTYLVRVNAMNVPVAEGATFALAITGDVAWGP